MAIAFVSRQFNFNRIIKQVAEFKKLNATRKNIHGPRTRTLKISNEEMEGIIKIVSILKQLKMKQKKNGGFIGFSLDTLGASLWGNMLAGKSFI